MNIFPLLHPEVNINPTIVSDYLNESEKTRPFVEHFPKIDHFKHLIEKRKHFPKEQRELLRKIISEQYESVHLEPSKNLNLLTNDNTFTVTTGHQLSLFGGPLFMFYKIMSTITLAQKLNARFPETHILPIFWMASEDHDFEEINTVYLFGEEVQWSTHQKGAVGNFQLSGIKEVLTKIIEQLDQKPNEKELIALLQHAYQEKRTLSEATRIFLHYFFKQNDLIIIDANQKELKKSFVSIMEEELVHQTSFKHVSKTNKKLEELNYNVQALPREINLFYLEQNDRIRIEKIEDRFIIGSISFTQDQILNELKTNPQKFSPNVILRPLYQEHILPNLAYIGGPGELSYWMQLKEAFHTYHVSFPILIRRNSFLLLNNRTIKKIEKLDLQLLDFFESVDLLKKKYVEQNIAIDFENEEQTLIKAFNQIVEKLSKIDQSLKGFGLAEQKKLIKQLNYIKGKGHKTWKQKNETALEQIDQVKEELFPEGILQERINNILEYYVIHGKVLLQELMEKSDPLNN